MGRDLRILAIADLHGRAEQLLRLKVDGVDLIVACGDLHNGGTEAEARLVVEALASLGLPVLIVPGNMDPKQFAAQLWEEAGFILLHRRAYRFKTYGFIGMGGMVVRSVRRLGDETKYYHRDEEVYEALTMVHKEIAEDKRQIVVTHQPPLMILDTLYNGEPSGCASLRRFLEEYRPDLFICGHIHESRGEATLGETVAVNVGELRNGYCAIIEIGDEVSVNWIVP